MNQINQAISLLAYFVIGIFVIYIIAVVFISYLKEKTRESGIPVYELNRKKSYIHLLTVVALGAWASFLFVAKLKFISIFAGGGAIVGMFLIVKNTVFQQEPINLKGAKDNVIQPKEPALNEDNKGQKQIRQPHRKRYQGKFHLINKSETELMNRLLLAVPAYNVFPQVSMSQIFYMESNSPDTKRKLVEIGKKSVDFVLCRKNDSSIVMAVEFNGPSHDDPIQQASDKVKRDALEEAGIPLLVYTSIPDVESIKTDIVHLVKERIKKEEERSLRIQQSKSSKQAINDSCLRSDETQATMKREDLVT